MIKNLKNVCTAFIVFLVYLYLYRTLLHTMYPHIPIMINGARDGISFSTVVESIIFTAFWEELVFRYAPIKIAQIMNAQLVWPVIFISSAIFGWGHGGLHGLMFQGVMGLLFSYVYLKNNYLSVVLLHAMWNTYCYLMF